MVKIIGAGPGAKDLITVRGMRALQEADVIIYAGSLVNEELLEYAKKECEIYNSAYMNLDEVIDVIVKAEQAGKKVVRLHTGDPAAALNCDYTVPEVSQTVILTRMEGRTPVPEKEKLSLLAQHGASMAVFLSAGHLKELQEQLCEGAYTPDTPCAIVYKASWAEQQCIKTTIKELEQKAREAGITKTALVLVGDFLGEQYAFSKLYDPEFQTEYRK